MSAELWSVLRDLAAEHATGALRIGAGGSGGADADPDGGAIYLVDGQITHAEAAAAPDLGRLLTTSGRLPLSAWQETVDAFDPGRGLGRMLVDAGHITQGELELSAAGALLDAAYFTLAADNPTVSWEDGTRHWLGPAWSVAADSLHREIERRQELLRAAHPVAAVDTAPVVPAAHLSRQHIALNALQWELIVHSDGRRTPIELAHLLGRAAYATLLTVRRMAAARLVEPPGAVVSARRPAPAAPRQRKTAGRRSTESQRPGDPHRVAPAAPHRAAPAAPHRATEPRRSGVDEPTTKLAPLPKRRAGAHLPPTVAADGRPNARPADPALLNRVRRGLEEIV